MTLDRRSLLAAGAVASAAPVLAMAPRRAAPIAFPRGFLWGAATSGYQTEGNNLASDSYLLERVRPTVFKEPAGDACNSFELWERDLDLVKAIGLNSYRFSLEWARIEPAQGEISVAMLDHYQRMIAGCRARGLTPIVTFCHFTAPRWFAAAGGWLNPAAPGLFAGFCARAMRHLGAGIGRAVTLNEPNLARLLRYFPIPKQAFAAQAAMLEAAAKASGAAKFNTMNFTAQDDLNAVLPIAIAAHRAARDAIKSARPDLPVGVSLAMEDEAAAPGGERRRDAVRADIYGAWLEAVRGDDFLGVQNYARRLWDANGLVPPPAGAALNWLHSEIYPASLGNAVRYAHTASGCPIIVTEHGLGVADDRLRAAFIPAALTGLRQAIADGVPVQGYVHWSLLDNFEWDSGYGPQLGLATVDRTSFKRTPKPSASVFGAIARRNAL